MLDQHDDADIRRRAALTCAKVLLMAAKEEGARGGYEEEDKKNKNKKNGTHASHASIIRFDSVLDANGDRRHGERRGGGGAAAAGVGVNPNQRSLLIRAQQAMVITERLIVAAISDPDPRLRAEVLSTFATDSRYVNIYILLNSFFFLLSLVCTVLTSLRYTLCYSFH